MADSDNSRTLSLVTIANSQNRGSMHPFSTLLSVGEGQTTAFFR